MVQKRMMLPGDSGRYTDDREGAEDGKRAGQLLLVTHPKGPPSSYHTHMHTHTQTHVSQGTQAPVALSTLHLALAQHDWNSTHLLSWLTLFSPQVRTAPHLAPQTVGCCVLT